MMKRKIIITETDEGVEVERFLIDHNGDLHKDESEDNATEMHHLFHQARHKVKTEQMKKKQEEIKIKNKEL